jgi:hypothetical protein
MKRRLQAGEGNLDGIIILAVLLIIIIIMPKTPRSNEVAPGTTVTSVGSSGLFSSSSYAPSRGESGGLLSGATLESVSEAQYISLGSGNAPYSYQAYEEYITIDNTGEAPVNITNWQLRNGKDKRPYYQGSSLQRFSADIALIPKAARYLYPFGQSPIEDVVLERGERAIVTTGSVSVASPYRITSFKENKCSGYLERLPDYAFTPPLTQNCPRPDLEPGIENLPPECRNVIMTIGSCQTPEFTTRDHNRQPCDNCLNGQSLPSYCANFIREHYSYQGCIANHLNDADFEGRTWRIFLGRGWEMWAKEYETIELFNEQGQLISFQNYR